MAKKNWKPMDSKKFGYDVSVRSNADRPYTPQLSRCQMSH